MKVETKCELEFEFSEHEVKQILIDLKAVKPEDLEEARLTSVGGGGRGRKLRLRFTKSSTPADLC